MMYKTRNVLVRMTERDYDIISRKAEILQMSVSEYVRTSATNRVVKGFKFAEVKVDEDLVGQLKIIDTAMNLEEKPRRGRPRKNPESRKEETEKPRRGRPPKKKENIVQ